MTRVADDDMRITRTLLVLEATWKQHRHLRLVQLIGNLIQQGEDGYYLDDDELVRRLLEYSADGVNEEGR